MTNMPFIHAASVVIFLCALLGLLANLMAFRRFAVASVRPLLGWTIISQFFLCLTLAIEEMRDMVFHLSTQGLLNSRWFPDLHPWPVIAVLAKVSLGASVAFSATMLIGLLWRAEEASIRRAAACSVSWTFVIWLMLSLSLQVF